MKTIVNHYQKNVAFTDMEGKSVFVEITVHAGKLSMSGNIPGHGAGQIVDEIKPANEAQQSLIDIWNTYHLNDMKAGTTKQMKVTKGLQYDQALLALIQHDHQGKLIEEETRKGVLNVWEQFLKCTIELDYYNLMASLGVNELVLAGKGSAKDTAERFLFAETLLFDPSYLVDGKPYRYGTRWLKEELPINIIDQLDGITAAIGGEFQGSPYEKQANDFLESIGATFEAKFLERAKFFEDDKEERDIYKITFERKGRYPFTLKFGQSLAKSGKWMVYDRGKHFYNDVKDAKKNHWTSQAEKNKDFAEPSAYDVLACITKQSPGTLDEFCDEFGYDTDSKKAERVYNSVCDEWRKVIAFFSPEEVYKLQDIA